MDQNVSNIFISKFAIDKSILYAKILWKPNEDDLFHIKIYEDGNTWTGRYSNDFAKKCRELIDETVEEYITNVKGALTGDHALFTHDLTPVQGDNRTNTFRWLKRFEDAFLVHGCVPVHQDDTPQSKDDLIDLLLLQNKDLRSTIEKLNRQNEQIDQDFERCKIELEKFVNIKTSLETSLYGKFVQLLNAKKKRIQLLEDNLQILEEPNKSSHDNELD